MTETPAYPGYATPAFTRGEDGIWLVWTRPDWLLVGRVFDRMPTGWTASTQSGHRVGLFPDKQAAGEALIRHAGYEVLA